MTYHYSERIVHNKIIYGWKYTARLGYFIGPFVKDVDKLYYGCFDKELK